MNKKIWILTTTVFFILLTVKPSSSDIMGKHQLTNIWASWVQIVVTPTIFTFPANSRDIYILNGNAAVKEVCVDLRAQNGSNFNCSDPNVLRLNSPSQLRLHDFPTSSIGVRTNQSGASPMSVIVIY